jgi:hypothetical protein
MPNRFRFNDFRNIDLCRCIPVNNDVRPGFRGYVTQFRHKTQTQLANAFQCASVRLDK